MNTSQPKEATEKYRLVGGKHTVRDGTNVRHFMPGDQLMLTPSYVALFPNVFERVTVPDPDKKPVVQKQSSEPSAPAAPTLLQLEDGIAALPETLSNPDVVYESAEEAVEDFRTVFGELLHDGYVEQITKAFEVTEAGTS